MTPRPSTPAEIESYEQTRRRRAGEFAVAAARTGGTRARTGAAAAAVRLGRGLAAAPADLLAYVLAADAMAAVEEAPAGDPRTKATVQLGIVRRERRANVVSAALLAVMIWTGGLSSLAHLVGGWRGWAAAVAGLLLLAGVAALSSMAAWRGKVNAGWTWPVRLWTVVVVAVAALWGSAAIGVWPLRIGLVVLAGTWLLWAAGDGSIRDNLGDEAEAPTVPAEVVHDATPPVVRAVLATGKLPKGTEPQLVMPGVVPGNGGAIWTAAVDTGGPSATVLLETKARRELAAQLGLSERRLILTVNEDRGARLHLTGVVGDPFRAERHPLLSMPQVDLWDGIPFGLALDGSRVTYQVDGVNSLFGGDSGAGKSTAAACVWAGFVLSPASRIWVIDGGEVDTEPLRRSGVATAWTTDLAEGIEILREVEAEVDRAQHALARDGLRKVSPAWFAERGGAHDLLVIDELATFTQRKGDKLAAEFAERLRPILQRARKTGRHVLLSTQSPSVDALEADARDVIPARWCGRTKSVDLAAKVLGRGAVGYGIDPRNLPKVKGVGWYSTPDGDTVVRPTHLTDDDLAELCRRGAAVRRGRQAAPASQQDESRRTVAAVAALIRAEGVDRTHRGEMHRVMRAADVAARLGMEQMALHAALSKHAVGTQKVRRTDDPDADNRAHYVLADFPIRRAG